MRPARIVLVDDNEDFLDAITRFLADRPQFRIVGTMLSGGDALLRIPKLTPDLVLMDLVMRPLNGLETTQRLREVASPPLIIMASLHDDPSFRTAARRAGADGFLSKQAFPKELVPLMESLLLGFGGLASEEVRST
jgi:DNA-binding NarL/FixJ family response regulator